MKLRSNSYYRGRIAFFCDAISVANKYGNTDALAYLRNGVSITPEATTAKAISEFAKDENNSPLSFVELCSFSTWFAMHPLKVAGREATTTSLHFPVSIKGDKHDVIATLKNGIATAKQKSKENIELLELEALAEIEILELLKI